MERSRSRFLIVSSTGREVSLHKALGYTGGMVKRMKKVMVFETFPLLAAWRLPGYEGKAVRHIIVSGNTRQTK